MSAREPGRCPLLPPMRLGALHPRNAEQPRHGARSDGPADRCGYLEEFHRPECRPIPGTFKKFSGPVRPTIRPDLALAGLHLRALSLVSLPEDVCVRADLCHRSRHGVLLLPQDLSADIIWRIIAGASANYIYYWHAKNSSPRSRANGLNRRRNQATAVGRTGRRPTLCRLGRRGAAGA